uniref:Inhibitory synaptic factor 1 n=1 Tax=Callithrix jacchus TaxID=9483 RepID=A0A8I3X096_CALJA
MNIRGAPDLGQPSDDPSSGGERERIRQRMKMVIGQLEGILRELKEVAKELREVVSQIDKLTSDFDFELEPDDWTTATVSSTSSSDKAGVGGPFDLGHLDFMTADILSDSWEFCSFLDVSTPSDSVDGPESTRPGAGPDYRLMNGGTPIPNGPRVETPDSSSEEAFGAGPTVKSQLPQRTPGTRERVRFSDKVLYHALCCDDEEGKDEFLLQIIHTNMSHGVPDTTSCSSKQRDRGVLHTVVVAAAKVGSLRETVAWEQILGKLKKLMVKSSEQGNFLCPPK